MRTLGTFFKKYWWVIGLGILLVVLILKPQSQTTPVATTTHPQKYDYESVYGNAASQQFILSLPVQGLILTEETPETSFLDQLSGTVTYGYSIKEQLRRAAEDERVKGVVLEIDSPGGTITGAEAIAEGVKYYRERTGKPIFTYAIAADSGGYWAAAATDRIIADQGSSVGSIGVIMGQLKEYSQVMEEGSILGTVRTNQPIKTITFTAGQSKDIGNPYRSLTAEESQHLQTMVDNEYQHFVNFVAERRQLSPDFIRGTVKAYFYETQRALELKLIDEVNTREATYHQLAAAHDLAEDEYQVVRETQPQTFLETLLMARSSFLSQPTTLNWGMLSSSLSFKPLVLHDPQGRLIQSF